MCPADGTGQPLRSGAVRALTPSEREWLEVRSYLQEHRHDLAARAAEEFPASARIAGTPLLAASGWQPAVPVPLPDISLELAAAADGAAATAWPPGDAAALPERADGTRYRSYSQALAELAAPAVFENRATYRLTAAALASDDSHVQKVCIWTPDKDLAQCVRSDRIVQVDRKSKAIRNADAVKTKFGVAPVLIPDYLALVGDSADGYPGIAGIGPKGAASLIGRYGSIEDFPPQVLGKRRDLALLFKKLATLRTDARLFTDVDGLRWHGPTARFSTCSERIGAPRLLARAANAFVTRR